MIVPRTMKCETLLLCNKCGEFEIKNKTINLETKDTLKKEKIGEGAREDKNEFATYKNKCSKCGYEKAEIIDIGVKYSDEDNLIFLKCGKCGFSERIGDKAM